MSEIISATWWTANTAGSDAMTVLIGAVAVNTIGGWKAYIGTGTGHNPMADQLRIYHNGAKMSREQACGCFPDFDPAKYVS